MITTKDGECRAECDDCGSEEYGGTPEFREFVTWLKEQGWRIRKDEDTWVHICPDCQR